MKYLMVFILIASSVHAEEDDKELIAVLESMDVTEEVVKQTPTEEEAATSDDEAEIAKELEGK